MTHSRGFTLVELSIVLVIIGLISAGILVGRDLMTSAAINSSIKQHETFVAAVYAFRDKYDCLPGDCVHATDYWPDAVTTVPEPVCTSAGWGSGNPISPNVCNGNGDGRLEWGFPSFGNGEVHGFWQHLSLAGMIKGGYSGSRIRSSGAPYSGDGWPFSVTGGVNAPASSLSDNACWSVLSSSNDPPDNPRRDTFHPLLVENIMTLGSSHNGHSGNLDYCYNIGFTAVAAFNIDTKIDDGKPGTGKVNGWLGGVERAPDCLVLNTADPVGQPELSVYNVQQDGDICALIFRDGF